MSKFQKATNFVGRHGEFFVGLAVGVLAPIAVQKVGGVNLPVKVKAQATIQSAD